MIDKEKKVYEFFNETNNYLHKDFGIHCRKEILFDLLGQIKNKRILDIGCGNGMVSLEYGHSNYLTLADISKNMIKISKNNAIIEKVDNVKFFVSSLDNLKNKKQYDIIIALGLLAHTNSLKSSIENFKKRLKKGGYLILQFSEFSSFRHYMSKLFSKYNYEVNKITKDEISHLLEKNNFVQVKQIRYSLLFPGMGLFPNWLLYRYTMFTYKNKFISKFGTDYILKVRLEK